MAKLFSLEIPLRPGSNGGLEGTFALKSELRAQRQAGGSASQWRQNSKTSWAVFEWERSQAAGTYNEADATHDVCSSQAVSRTTHRRIRGQLSDWFGVILPGSF
ncbi:hypothetical protein AWENTII_000278 [Aspergillus wentii]